MPADLTRFCKIPVEISLLLLFFTFGLVGSVYTNLIIYRTCYIVLGYNQTECALLGTHYDNATSKLEELVEPKATVITMTRSVIEQCCSVILCLFIGPWSDKFGRKPILIFSTFGYFLTFSLITIFSALDNLSPWYSLICSIPMMFVGGMSAFLIAVLAHITDITPEENRGLRMGVFEVIIAIGMLIGNVSSSYVFYALGYPGCFGIAAICSLISFLLCSFFTPESLNVIETGNKFQNLFKFSNILDMLKTAMKRRHFYNRAIIVCCILILTGYIFAIDGDISVFFFFLRDKFKWTLKKFTLYSSASSLVWISGTIFGVYFLSKVLKIRETYLVTMGMTSMFAGILMQGLATKDIHIYIANVIRVLGGVISPMIRALVSKISPADEVGKLFALIIITESLISLFAPPLYTFIYNETIHVDPAIYNFVTAGIYFVCILISIAVIIMKEKSPYLNYVHGILNEDQRSTVNEECGNNNLVNA